MTKRENLFKNVISCLVQCPIIFHVGCNKVFIMGSSIVKKTSIAFGTGLKIVKRNIPNTHV